MPARESEAETRAWERLRRRPTGQHEGDETASEAETEAWERAKQETARGRDVGREDLD